jgi:hypothetical protein
MPKELPHMYIIDPKGRKEIKKIVGLEQELKLDDNQFYLKKYQGFIFNISNPEQELNDFIEKFMDDKHPHHYVSEDRSQQNSVKWINADNFESDILKN